MADLQGNGIADVLKAIQNLEALLQETTSQKNTLSFRCDAPFNGTHTAQRQDVPIVTTNENSKTPHPPPPHEQIATQTDNERKFDSALFKFPAGHIPTETWNVGDPTRTYLHTPSEISMEEPKAGGGGAQQRQSSMNVAPGSVQQRPEHPHPPKTAPSDIGAQAARNGPFPRSATSGAEFAVPVLVRQAAVGSLQEACSETHHESSANWTVFVMVNSNTTYDQLTCKIHDALTNSGHLACCCGYSECSVKIGTAKERQSKSVDLLTPVWFGEWNIGPVLNFLARRQGQDLLVVMLGTDPEDLR
ncbi:hypothetical protein DL98DRAFT_584501 [Cadophora sp. DSE1049]|nr:hypothetical protein DL98DRAFT_584501 [Cadophora sp. DSE1049]